jgi:hypothetical protein
VSRRKKAALDFDDVSGLESFGSFDDIEFDLLALVERLETIAADRLEVHEDVFAPGLGDETETLLGVEPLYGATWHERSLLSSELVLKKRCSWCDKTAG